MARVEGPGSPFVWFMTAPQSDIDENCHISNIAYVRWVQEATRAHAEAIGWPKERYQHIGCYFVVRRHELEYLRPADAGELIKLVTWVDEFRIASAIRKTRILRAADDVELVNASTEWVFMSIADSRPKRVHPEVQAGFRNPVPTTPPVWPAD